MTDRRGDEGFAVEPRRVGGDDGRGGRRRKLGIVAVVMVIVGFVIAAGVGPRLSGRPGFDLSFFATPAPSRTPIPLPTPIRASTFPGPTSLPIMIRPTDVRLTGRLGVVVDGFRILDLETGIATIGPSVRPGRDAVFGDGAGGWTCVCFEDALSLEPNALLEELHVGIDGSASPVSTPGVGVADLRDREGTTGDIDITDDHRLAIVARAEAIQGDKGWTIRLASIDLAAGQVVDLKAIGEVPAPSRAAGSSPDPSGDPTAAEGVFVDGPHVRVAPDGTRAYVWALAQRYGPDAVVGTEQRAWQVQLDPSGKLVQVADAPGLAALPAFCPTVGFVSADRLAWACARFPMDGTGQAVPAFALGVLDADGTRVLDTVIAGAETLDGRVLFDRANGVILVWSPGTLALTRIDTATAAVSSTRFSTAVGSAPAVRDGSGDLPPEWRTGGSAVAGMADGPIVAEPGGTRLFLTGTTGGSLIAGPIPPSAGIFVADASTLAMIDRWAPAASYLSLSTALPGYVSASGLPGVDASGQEAPWAGTLTIHRIEDGAIVARYGQVGPFDPPIVIAP